MYCVVPPQIDRSFGRRLCSHGWVRTREWPKYNLEL
jgi:hypothetical protein